MRLEEYKEEAVEMMKIELQGKNGTCEHARCLRSKVLEPLRTPLIFGE